MPADNTVQFEILPSVFKDALKSVQEHLDVAKGNLFVAATESTESDRYEEHGCAVALFEENRGPRVILGLEGSDPNYRFVEVPVASVSEPGEFVINQVDRLQQWASESETLTEITYEREGNDMELRLDYDAGYDSIGVEPWHPEDISVVFEAHQQRFTTPMASAHSEELAGMLGIASKISPGGSGRVGDLCFGEEEDGKVEVDFFTRQRIKKTVFSTNQRAETEVPISGFDWEVRSRHLSLLESVFGNQTATINTYLTEGPRGDDLRMVEAAYQKEISNDKVMYVHHQTAARRENPPIHNWTGRSKLFAHDNCKVFCTSQATPLMQNLRKTWALKQCMIEATMTEDQKGKPKLQLQTKENGSVVDKKHINATPGESEIDRYLFNPKIQQTVEHVIGGAKFMQIRSFPTDEQELDNGYIALPVSEEKEDPTEPADDPDRYVVITWQKS